MPNVQLPINSERSFGRFGPIPDWDADYTDGPLTIGDVPPGFGRFETRWVGWATDNDVRIQTLDTFTGDLAGGQASGLFTGESPKNVSICFDGAGEIVVAAESDGTVSLRKYEVGVPTTYTFAGKTPMLFFTGLMYFDDALKEVIVFYLSADGTQIMLRRQLTNFATETVLATLPYALSRLTKVDRLEQYVWLWGMTVPSVATLRGDVKQVAIQSGMYPAWPQIVDDNPSASISIGPGGEYLEVIVSGVSEADQLSGSVEIADGEYLEVIVSQSETDTDLTGSVVMTDGEYVEVIVSQSETDTDLTGNVEIADGEYVELVKPTGTETDNPSGTITIQGGVYEIP